MLNSSNAEYKYQQFRDAYSDLSQWISSSLPKYRSELEKILLPVFIYFYLEMIKTYQADKAAKFFEQFYLSDYARDLDMIRNIGELRHMRFNDLQQNLVNGNNIMVVAMSPCAVDLLIGFIEASGHLAIMSVLIKFVHIFTTNNTNGHEPILLSKPDIEIYIHKTIPMTNPDEDQRKDTSLPLPENVRIPFDTSFSSRDLTIAFHAVTGPALCADMFNQYILVGFESSLIKLWDLKEKSSCPLVGHGGSVYALSIYNGESFVSGDVSGEIRLWSIQARACFCIYKGHGFPIWTIRFAPVGHYFVSGGLDKTVRLWATNAQKPLKVLAGHLSDVNVVAFHPSTHFIASGSNDRTVRIWETSSGNCLRIFTGFRAPISALSLSRNALYAGCELGWVKAYDVLGHELLWEHEVGEVVS